MKKALLSLPLPAFGLLLSGLATSAAQAQTLNLGSNYVHMNFTRDGGMTSQDEGGGSISPSSLNGFALPFVYCIDLDHNIPVPASYTPTGITMDGTVFGSPVNNAGQIAWLIDHYAASATTSDLQGGLQAAIWHEVFGANDYIVAGGNTTSGMLAAYNTDLAALGSNTDPVSNIKWLSPSDSNGARYQALVTVTPVPEPGSVALISCTLVSGSLFLRRRRSRK